jgi:hypothetical protein
MMEQIRREAEERRARKAAEFEAAKQAAGNVIDLPPPSLAKTSEGEG